MRLLGTLTVLLSLVGTATAAERHTPYVLEIRLLGGLVSFGLAGTMLERVDAERGRFEVRASGRGHDIENAMASTGILVDGQWAPETTDLRFAIWGRTYHTQIRFDWQRRLVHYQSRDESFFLRRPRTVDATLALDPDVHVDDPASITVNYADGRWLCDPDGKCRTFLVRRTSVPLSRSDGGAAYGAELGPLMLEAHTPDAHGRVLALVDITGFTAWGRRDEPARLVFGSDGRLERIDLRLRFGSSVRIRFGD